MVIEGHETLWSTTRFRERAALLYEDYETRYRSQFKWIRPIFFNRTLKRHLIADIQQLHEVAIHCGLWMPAT